MNVTCLDLENPIGDAISRIRFAPQSNNLLISSWDSRLRLYDVDCSLLRLEVPFEPALLDCCFEGESVAFASGSDGCITRCDLHSGISDTIGNHDDIASCVEFSDETCQVISAGLDKKIISWDTRKGNTFAFSGNFGAEVESMSVSGLEVTVAVGSSVHMYDLRNFSRPFQSDESSMDVQIRCVSSMPYSRGYAAGSVDGRVKLDISYQSNAKNLGYIFRCYPKSKDGKYYLVAVNDIAFNPFFSGAFVTGDDEGYVAAWDAKTKRRLFELPRCSNSVASLTYNYEGLFLAVASSCTYKQAFEVEKPPEIYIHRMDSEHPSQVPVQDTPGERLFQCN